jgi:hypothetical protein
MVGPVKRAYLAHRAGKVLLDATNFLNTKRRVIYRTTTGKYVVRTNKGVSYNPKAKYYKNPAGSTVATKFVKNIVPSPIRPKFNRKIRKNYGEPRGKYASRVPGVRVHHVKRRAYIGEMFEGYAPKRPVGRPRKHLVSPGGNMGLAALFGMKAVRKTRSNKGTKRGPRASKQ